LGIKINHQGTQTTRRTDGSQITGDGAFANTPFLIKHDSPHAIPPSECLDFAILGTLTYRSIFIGQVYD
jgi:hypothetical protein